MCDFHSVAVRRDGAIAHDPSNSHSAAVSKAGWIENNRPGGKARFVELEYDGKMPIDDIRDIIVSDTCGDELTDAQAKAGAVHYSELHQCLAGGVVLPRFEAVEYADVRREVANRTRDRDTLVKLAGDADAYVRGCVAQNSATPADTLVKLAGDADAYVRGEAKANPKYQSVKSS
jgi:hypothetical protein